MQINTGKDSNALVQRRKIEMEIVLLSSDIQKIERAVSALQAESRSLENQKKRVMLELERNASLLRTQEANLQRIRLDLGTRKKRLNTIRY